MSVEVKTPTKSQFKIEGFQCGERLKPGDSSDEKLQKESKTKVGKDVSFQDKNGEKQHRNSFSRADKPKEIQYRKRRYSMPQKLGEAAQGSHISFMKKRKFLMDAKVTGKKMTLPTKFLLGGNINDPLNLNSLYHDEEGKVLNESTPVSSPIPTPSHRQKVEVVIPPNITDPLNLNADDDSFMSRICKKRKRSYRHKRKESTSHSTSTPLLKEGPGEKKRELLEALKIDIDTSHDICDELSSGELTLDIQSANTNKCSNKIVSPVIPQASPKIRRRRKTISESCNISETTFDASRALFCTSSPEPKLTPPKKTKRQFSNPKSSSFSKTKSPVKFAKKSKFIYGNYNRYYGYRNPSAEQDHRMINFESEWFETKDVLDIGCNVGHLTLAIARDYHPRKIIGMDIDANLIKIARKNIRYYLASCSTDTTKFATSSSVNYGPMAAPPLGKEHEFPQFPNNLMFMQGNIVLESDEMLEFQEEEYDLVLALSITKWIHLNWGDDGLKRAFKRIFKLLRPGGKLILEPQAWASYKKRKKLNETIFKNYQNIKLRPENFPNYLLKEVGFSKCEVIGVPFNKSKGFRRPLQLYTKADTSGNTPYTDIDENSQSSRNHVLAPTLHSVVSPQVVDSQDTPSEKSKAASPVQLESEQSIPQTPQAMDSQDTPSEKSKTASPVQLESEQSIPLTPQAMDSQDTPSEKSKAASQVQLESGQSA
ncbi:LOW QUALITY PROTEIN: 7SK snRNA methylphosphate capping enzyme-like [Haliotis rubra]|uniref:LOW QUALITY PROTEIN: 7SK snRNA methylphosphate capping enzyme-like n=1 Tax=Haliotis rubra TaxID=36100 RepID=UPI001EE5102C|nr:LOW QUALITY PROTEIN: 7SK snRNA methylphosphate capping enzyme-like [Haliotis rubra]